MAVPHPHFHAAPVYPFDARRIPRGFRDTAIFVAFDALQPGEVMRVVNDQDPLPLLEQFRARYGEGVNIECRRREPDTIVIDVQHA